MRGSRESLFASKRVVALRCADSWGSIKPGRRALSRTCRCLLGLQDGFCLPVCATLTLLRRQVTGTRGRSPTLGRRVNELTLIWRGTGNFEVALSSQPTKEPSPVHRAARPLIQSTSACACHLPHTLIVCDSCRHPLCCLGAKPGICHRLCAVVRPEAARLLDRCAVVSLTPRFHPQALECHRYSRASWRRMALPTRSPQTRSWRPWRQCVAETRGRRKLPWTTWESSKNRLG